MTASNHILTGAVVAISVKNPLLAISLSYLSHFAIDALPHFGPPGIKGLVESINHRAFRVGVALELLLLAPVILLIFHLTSGITPAWLLVTCMLVADLPDILWVPIYLYEVKQQTPKTLGPIAKFHGQIQKHSYWGIMTEIIWFAGMLIILFKIT